MDLLVYGIYKTRCTLFQTQVNQVFKWWFQDYSSLYLIAVFAPSPQLVRRMDANRSVFFLAQLFQATESIFLNNAYQSSRSNSFILGWGTCSLVNPPLLLYLVVWGCGLRSSPPEWHGLRMRKDYSQRKIRDLLTEDEMDRTAQTTDVLYTTRPNLLSKFLSPLYCFLSLQDKIILSEPHPFSFPGMKENIRTCSPDVYYHITCTQSFLRGPGSECWD